MTDKLSFGEQLRIMREAKGISSSKLSTAIGKTRSYVSQIERGLIKYPDYNAAYKLMVLVGFEKSKIDDILELFSIYSPEKMKYKLQIEDLIDEAWIAKEEELNNDEDYQQHKAEEQIEWYLADSINKLNETNESIYKIFESFINRNLYQAELLLNNIKKMTETKETFNFFCELNQKNFSKLDNDKLNILLNIIEEFIATNENNHSD